MPPVNLGNGTVIYLTGNEVMAIMTFFTGSVGAISAALWSRLNKKDDAFTDIIRGQIEGTIKQNAGLDALTDALKSLAQSVEKLNENYRDLKVELANIKSQLDTTRRG